MDIKRVRIRFDSARLLEIVRFYQAAAVNAAFGYGVYALFVRLGLNIYLAQILAHSLGTAFNYVTYSRHVFRGSAPAKARFLAAYAGNYLIGLACLAMASLAVQSSYLAGLIALVLASVVNYFALKYVVFVRRLGS